MNIRNEEMRQVVWLSQTDSAFFESVCFILRKDAEGAEGKDIVAEAERIVTEYVDKRWNGRYRRTRRRGFGAGLAIGIAVTLAAVAVAFGVIAIFA